MSTYHSPSCPLAAMAAFAFAGAVDAKAPKTDGFPCTQQTLKRIESHSGGFEIVPQQLLEAPVATPISLPLGNAVHIDRALLSQLVAPLPENGR